MKPLILEYTETPNFIESDSNPIEYCDNKNLSVLKDTKKTAISYVNMETETFTKTNGEPSDSDSDLRNNLKILMGTETRTYTETEASDSDRDRMQFKQLLDTRTLNESVGTSDSDRN